MRPLPRRLLVGHVLYRIRPDEAACDKIDGDGAWQIDNQTISIRPGMAPDSRREVLTHEALHACVYAAGLDDELDPDLEERIVGRLAPVVLDLLRDNPTFVDYVREGTRGGPRRVD